MKKGKKGKKKEGNRECIHGAIRKERRGGRAVRRKEKRKEKDLK